MTSGTPLLPHYPLSPNGHGWWRSLVRQDRPLPDPPLLRGAAALPSPGEERLPQLGR